MTIAAVVAHPLYSGHISQGLNAVTTELRHALIDTIGGQAFESASGIEYMMWGAAALNTLGAPALNGIGATDGAGVFIVDTTGTFNSGDAVIALIRQVVSGSGDQNDNWGVIVDTISAS